jgi:hypothetical protein
LMRALSHPASHQLGMQRHTRVPLAAALRHVAPQ